MKRLNQAANLDDGSPATEDKDEYSKRKINSLNPQTRDSERLAAFMNDLATRKSLVNSSTRQLITEQATFQHVASSINIQPIQHVASSINIQPIQHVSPSQTSMERIIKPITQLSVDISDDLAINPYMQNACSFNNQIRELREFMELKFSEILDQIKKKKKAEITEVVS